ESVRKADKSTQQEDTQPSNDSDIRGSTRSQSDDNLNNVNKRPVRDVEKPRRASIGAPERRKSVKKATQLERTFFSANDTQVQPFAFPDVAQLPKSNKKLDPIGASPSLRGRRLDPISSYGSGTIIQVQPTPIPFTNIITKPPDDDVNANAKRRIINKSRKYCSFNASTTYIESLDKVRSLREIVVEARHHRHEHWHTPIVPPNEAELAIITDLELRIAEELKSLPSLATSPYTSEGSIAASRASVSSGDKNPRLSMLIKNATLKMEKLREETEAERSTQESLAENEFMEDVKDSLWGCFCCCCERKDRRVEPEPLSVYEQQKLELLKSRTSTTVRDSTTSRDKRTSLRPSVTK
ncbi:hypothetical protein BCR33DRAFT_714137, partial [Rhizoclosmatium globosum]